MHSEQSYAPGPSFKAAASSSSLVGLCLNLTDMEEMDDEPLYYVMSSFRSCFGV